MYGKSFRIVLNLLKFFSNNGILFHFNYSILSDDHLITYCCCNDTEAARSCLLRSIVQVHTSISIFMEVIILL